MGKKRLFVHALQNTVKKVTGLYRSKRTSQRIYKKLCTTSGNESWIRKYHNAKVQKGVTRLDNDSQFKIAQELLQGVNDG